MARQMKAEWEKRPNIPEAKGFFKSGTLKAKGEKQSTTLEAKGRREGAYHDAEAREREGEAEAKVTTMVSSAIDGSNF